MTIPVYAAKKHLKKGVSTNAHQAKILEQIVNGVFFVLDIKTDLLQDENFDTDKYRFIRNISESMTKSLLKDKVFDNIDNDQNLTVNEDERNDYTAFIQEEVKKFFMEKLSYDGYKKISDIVAATFNDKNIKDLSNLDCISHIIDTQINQEQNQMMRMYMHCAVVSLLCASNIASLAALLVAVNPPAAVSVVGATIICVVYAANAYIEYQKIQEIKNSPESLAFPMMIEQKLQGEEFVKATHGVAYNTDIERQSLDIIRNILQNASNKTTYSDMALKALYTEFTKAITSNTNLDPAVGRS